MLDVGEFRKWRAVFWLLALVWLSLVASVVLWLPLGAAWKGGLIFFLAALAPAATDLIQSYESYREEWRTRNDQGKRKENS